MFAAFTEEAFAAYVAGFTDGEGYIGSRVPGHRPNGTRLVRITLANTHPRVLHAIRDRLHYGTIRSQQAHEHWLERFTYHIDNMTDAEHFLTMIRPYLVVKAPAADQALETIRLARQHRIDRFERNKAILAAAASGERRKDIAARFAISPQLVSRICVGHTWPSVSSEYAKARARNPHGRFMDLYSLHGQEPPQSAPQSND